MTNADVSFNSSVCGIPKHCNTSNHTYPITFGFVSFRDDSDDVELAVIVEAVDDRFEDIVDFLVLVVQRLLPKPVGDGDDDLDLDRDGEGPRPQE